MKNAVKTIMIFMTAFLFAFTVKADNNSNSTLSKEIIALKPSSVVIENNITLGDIFTGVEEYAGKTVAIAPAPGGQIILDAKQLFRIARALNLNWRPISMQTSIVISRASSIVKGEEIEDVVTQSLLEKGVEKDAEIVFNSRDIEINIPININPSIVVRDLVIDNSKRRFSGTVDVVANETSFGKARIAGQIFPTALVPMLNNTIPAGSIIKNSDVSLETVRSEQLKSNTIIDKRKIIGMEAKRNLRKGNTVQFSEIDRPVLVSRNQLVSIIINTPYMNLTAKGQAQENGSEGDLIKVVNTRSNKVIQARVTGEATVSVENFNNHTTVAMQ